MSHPDYKPNDSLIMACHITGVFDVNRNMTLAHDNYSLIQSWAESVAAAKIKGVLFHNNLSQETCETYTSEFISFVGIHHNPIFNPNVFRYFVYRDYLKNLQKPISAVFITDVSDVVLISNPFEAVRFIDQPEAIFCGDEAKVLDNEWMRDHATHLRAQITDYAAYENQFGQETLLNCGVIGGHFSSFYGFLEKLCELHERYNTNNKTAYTGDMGAFNYLARTEYADRLISGPPVNTVFKLYETERTDCWFRHK